MSAGLGGLIQVSFKTKYDKGPGFEQKSRAWIRLGELAVLDRKFSLFLFFVRSQFKSIISLDTTSFLSRVQIYWCMSSYLSRFMASSTSDLSTLALITYPLSRSKAMALWSRARKAQLSRPYERLVLESFVVDKAAERLRARGRGLSPLFQVQ